MAESPRGYSVLFLIFILALFVSSEIVNSFLKAHNYYWPLFLYLLILLIMILLVSFYYQYRVAPKQNSFMFLIVRSFFLICLVLIIAETITFPLHYYANIVGNISSIEGNISSIGGNISSIGGNISSIGENISSIGENISGSSLFYVGRLN
jgi:asparagine N-glycosylation enzyme membrane subunit Stt3